MSDFDYYDLPEPTNEPVGLGKCPWGNCGNGMYCPGCGGVSLVFPELFMSCGTEVACPYCFGYAFAENDRDMVRYMDGLKGEEYLEEWWNRVDILEKRRTELGMRRYYMSKEEEEELKKKEEEEKMRKEEEEKMKKEEQDNDQEAAKAEGLAPAVSSEEVNSITAEEARAE